MKDLLIIFQMKVIYAHNTFKVVSRLDCVWLQSGYPTRLPVLLPAVAIDLSSKNTKNVSQYNDYELVDDRRRANCRNTCINCTTLASDEPVEIGRLISGWNMLTEFSRFRFIFPSVIFLCHAINLPFYWFLCVLISLILSSHIYHMNVRRFAYISSCL